VIGVSDPYRLRHWSVAAGPTNCSLPQGGGTAVNHFVPSFTGTLSRERFLFSQDTTIYADDEVKIVAVRSDGAGGASASVAISG
jgi:hypothetical protein